MYDKIEMELENTLLNIGLDSWAVNIIINSKEFKEFACKCIGWRFDENEDLEWARETKSILMNFIETGYFL